MKCKICQTNETDNTSEIYWHCSHGWSENVSHCRNCKKLYKRKEDTQKYCSVICRQEFLNKLPEYLQEQRDLDNKIFKELKVRVI